MKSNFLLHDDVQVTGGLRFANLIIDVICIYVIIFVIVTSCYLLTYLGIMAPALWFIKISGTEDRLFGLLVCFLYYFIFEATTQRTMGKFITGTMVIDGNGEKPSAPSLAGRTLLRLIGIDALTFLGNRRGWHDTASNTYVVKAKKWKELIALENSFDEIGNPNAPTVTTSKL